MNLGIAFEKYGSIENLRLLNIPLPTSPKKGNALVRIDAFSLNPRDISIIEGDFKFLSGHKFPKLTGADFSGEIVSVPKGDNTFNLGDQVFGYYEDLKGGVSCQVCEIPLKYMIEKPKNVSTYVAAAVGCTYLTAYKALVDKARITKRDRILIYGASGGVGTAAIQIAKVLEAHVTAVSHSRNKEYCLSNGADNFLAYDKTNIFDVEDKYDLFFQVYSAQGDLYGKGKNIVKRNGCYLSLIPNPITKFLGLFRKPKSDHILVKTNKEHLSQIANWIDSGKLNPYIANVFQKGNFLKAFKDLQQRKINGKAIVALNK